jgi:uncharacterized protein YcnI
MRLNLQSVGTLSGAALLLATAGAHAHVEIAAPAFAGTSQIITLNVGHGCEGADTVGVEVQIPKEVTSVRGLPNFFGFADVKTDASGAVTSVVWTKTDTRPADDQFYQVQIRIKVPEMPFQTLYFPTTQHCRNAEGDESSTAWTSTATPVPEGKEPAPALVVLPPRTPGWNKYTAPKNITDLSVFDDAQIVWVGDSAYSPNEATAAMIASEDGVSQLTKIDAKAEIWVKY